MKKMLILGGFPQMIDIVQTAKSMGIYTIVVDREPSSPAKKYADKAFNISTDKIDELVELCKDEQVDGVFTGFEDFNIHIARILCERLHLPFYATEDQLDIVTNKNTFKSVCRKFGVPVIEQYTIEEALLKEEYPYIIKPVDSYGSRGITVSRTSVSLKDGYEKAMSTSRTNSAIIERFAESNQGVELFYTIVNGAIYLTATADRFTVTNGDADVPLPVAEVFPSKHNSEIKSLDQRIQRMLLGIGIKNGVVLIQAMYTAGAFFVYEMAYRLTGEQHYLFVEKQRGISLKKMMIQLALGEDISEFDTALLKHEEFVYPAINYAILLKPGILWSIRGLEHIFQMSEFINCIQTHFEKDQISATRDYSCMLIRLNMIAQDCTQLREAVERVNGWIEATSALGEDMLVSKFYL